MVSYQVEHVIVTGATDPDGVSRICRHPGVKHVNVDLPGKLTASVISDNFWGAQPLTTSLIKGSRPQGSKVRHRFYFLGGIAADYATGRRIEGLSATLKATFGAMVTTQVNACGYEAHAAEVAVRDLYAMIGGLPRGCS